MTALLELGSRRSYTYAELGGIVNALAVRWKEKSLSRVCIILGDSGIDTVAVFLATQVTGRVAVMLDRENLTSLGKDLIDRRPESVVDVSTEVTTLDWTAASFVDMSVEPDRNEVGAAFLTSGSTGEPKIFGARRDTSFEMAREVGPEEIYTVLNLRRPSVVAFRANIGRMLSGRGTFVTAEMLDVRPADLDVMLADTSITEINVTRTMLDRVITGAKAEWFNSIARVNLSGEKVRAADLQKISARYPDLTVCNAYGLTEFGSICRRVFGVEDLRVVRDPVPVGWPVEGIEVRVVDEGAAALPVGATGSVEIRGSIFGFHGRICDDGDLEFSPMSRTDWIPTGDRGFLIDSGELVVLGRVQETINVRGSRLSLTEIETVIRQTGLVEDVLAAEYDDNGNTALGVVVVPVQGAEVSLAEIRRRMVETVKLVMCPTRLVETDRIPTLPGGKVDRLTASSMLQDPAPRKLLRTEQLSATERTMKTIICRVLDREDLGINDDLFALGLDSMRALQLLAEIEERLGNECDIGLILENPTFGQLVAAVSKPLPQRGRIVRPRGVVAGPRIYWVLPGANPYMVGPVSRELSEFEHVVPLQLGALADDVVQGGFDQMIAVIVNAIINDLGDDPFIIAGFSSASYLANGVTASLMDAGRAPAGQITIDPPDYTTIVGNRRDSGKVADPVHIMLGREGRLVLLDPVQRDYALFGLQAFGLSRHTPREVQIPTLLIGADYDAVSRSPWSDVDGVERRVVRQRHLDFIRKPASIVDQLRDFVLRVCGTSLR